MNHKHNTPMLTRQEALNSRKWYLFDATGKTLGRFAAEVAKVLRGKHRTDYTPNIDCGDGVIIINAEKIEVTGMKEARKIYRRHTEYVGGLREVPFSTMRARNPQYILERAIHGMMPKTRLGAQQVRKLRIFKGDQHGLQAQQPIPVNI